MTKVGALSLDVYKNQMVHIAIKASTEILRFSNAIQSTSRRRNIVFRIKN